MKALAVVLSLAVTTSVFAQTVTRGFGSVVFPGGTSSTAPGITRNFGSVVFPGGAPVPTIRGASPIGGVLSPGVHPSSVTSQYPQQRFNGQNFRRNPPGRDTHSQTYVYAYPVFVGGGYDNGYAPQEQAPQQQAPQPQAPQPQAPPNVTVVFPPAQHASPVMIQAGQEGEYYTSGQRQGDRQGAMIYDSPRTAPVQEVTPEPAATDANRFLIAFKDHTIYSAVAYWADGDTLHYFTSGNTHNQASVSLIDRELTERLNKELGFDFKLPPAK